ncbi:putative P-loop containing nucleoside triphosphate hydrolase, leucine-rich repeat domain, L [Medicago truncatula]|uniref:Putative P-loop containing nucleoside triphosphate hydrolase, leucine-rich repeat domain, L n=2 Tax=Medicago truncatula TaxID=3880 RepID=A0A396HGM4_MEDTR|nr:putative P-loop containing nucleoside triphosphate hydrolase, leucine-rich repeat domain, L [Medicago truncatula]
MVGLHGAGGMGKSTLAKAIFNFIADQFEGSYFLEDVKENSTLNNLKHLQEKILMKTVRLDDKLGGVSEGITKIKKMLCQKKILLILDDVDKLEQLEALAGGLDWFGGGSRVIITTRNRQLLTYHGIERLHHVSGLYDEEAHKLLRLMAFKNGEVPSSYEGIFNRALTYVSGLPLAIVTIGSNLFGRSVEDWERILDEYEKIPNKEIQRILKVSYDALEEKEKSVFLDIACCFKGCKWTKVKDILHAHYGHCIKHHVEVLAEKSLINHRENDSYMRLHDLIEDMGREVVRQESPDNPGERSRLWFHDDIVQVLKENIGTWKIEMIYLKCPSVENVIKWSGKAFTKMKNLKTFIIENGHFSKGPNYLPSSLRFWKWKGYPSASLLCVLNKTFEKMKILKIDNCEYLTNIPDVSCLPNLEKISFKNCKSLVTIHDSIGFLSQLQILNAADCNKLLSFPPLKLKSLRKLKLSGCTSLKKFPEILGKMENIKKIILRKTGIEELPFSFNNLTRLTDLTIEGCGILKLPTSILMMSNLFEVTVSGYTQLLSKPDDKLSSTLSANVNVLCLNASNDEFLTIALMWFSNVETLHLSGSNIKILPESLKNCLSIKCIDLYGCGTLEEIRGIPPNLEALSALRCKSLTSSSKRMLMSQELHESGSIECCFPSILNERIPEWFEHQTNKSISFSFRNNLPSLVFLFSSKLVSDMYPSIRVYLIINDNVYNSRIGLVPGHTYLFPFKVQDWYLEEYQKLKSMLDEALLKNEWIHAEVRFCDWGKEYVVESGIHVIKHLTNMDDFQFTDSLLRKNKISDEYLKSSRSVMKLLNDEDISATPPRYRVLKTMISQPPYVVTSSEKDLNFCAIM